MESSTVAVTTLFNPRWMAAASFSMLVTNLYRASWVMYCSRLPAVTATSLPPGTSSIYSTSRRAAS
jgi:hypothetical protein